MNYRNVLRTLGFVMLIETVCLLPSVIFAAVYRESLVPYLNTAGILIVLGLPLSRIKLRNVHFTARAGFVSVVLAWLVLSLFGALPMYFCGHGISYVDCFFETVSGFTTTGSTILNDIEALPKGILFWRSFTHFLGGMGILVLATAILSTSGDRSHHLMEAEVPGPTADKLVPKLAQSSKILYQIYAIMTAVQTVLLLVAGLDFYNALNVAVATAGTGGFAVLNSSIAGYFSASVELITAVFMIAFGVNFSVYYFIITGKFKQVIECDEVKFYLAVIVGAVALIAMNIYGVYEDIWMCLRYSFFTVASIISTTGFAIVDHDLWPTFSKIIVVMLMFCGACAGSTGGGIKISRVLILLRSVTHEIRQIVHPRAVSVVRFDGKAMEDRTVVSVLRFIGAYFIIMLLSTLFISAFDNQSFTTNITAVISCMSNIGPGLDAVGPVRNFALYSDASKVILSVCMLTGRLEIFPILIFLSPKTWKRI